MELNLRQQNDALNDRINKVMEQGAYKLQDKIGGGGNEISDQIRTLMDQIDNKPNASGSNPSTGSFSQVQSLSITPTTPVQPS